MSVYRELQKYFPTQISKDSNIHQFRSLESTNPSLLNQQRFPFLGLSVTITTEYIVRQTNTPYLTLKL